MNSDSFAHLANMIKNGKLPFRAEITSKDGTPASMTVTNATMIDEHGEHEIFDDQIELSVGGDGPAEAIFEVPIQTEKLGKVSTSGDANVTNASEFYDVCIEGKKKLKAQSQNGMFASVITQLQRNIDADVCHIFFGVKGKEETVGSDGQKDRPHICLGSTGVGLHTRLSYYKCSISSESAYDRHQKTLSIDRINIVIEDWAEQLVVNFEVDHAAKRVMIINVDFTSVDTL